MDNADAERKAVIRSSYLRRKILVLSIVSILVLSVFLYTRRKEPCLITVNFNPAAIRPRTYAIMNPFRDRSPEKAADQYLRLIKSGGIKSFEKLLGANRENIMEGETRYPIASWHIGGRTDTDGYCRLRYWVRRANGYSGEEEVYMDLFWKGKWILQCYNAIY
jgi:hypothetical protein